MKPQFLWFGFEASIVIKETKTILIMETAMTDPIRYKQNDAFSSPLPVTSEWTNRISPYLILLVKSEMWEIAGKKCLKSASEDYISKLFPT